MSLSRFVKPATTIGSRLLGHAQEGARAVGRMGGPLQIMTLGGGTAAEWAAKNLGGVVTRTKALNQNTGQMHERLTPGGLTARTLGNLMGGGVALKSYLGQNENAPKDQNGAKNPYYNEEYQKGRTKFLQEYMGGDNRMTPDKYRMLGEQSKWVRTAIQNMGADKYKRMRRALVESRDPSQAAMALHSALTDELAKLGDTESMKAAGGMPILLPGVAKTNAGKGRIIVLNPKKGKEGSQTTFDTYLFDAEEE